MNYLVKLRRCFQILGSLPIWKAEADEKAIRIERQNEQLLMQTGEQSRSFAQLAENVAQLQTCQQKQNARQEQLAAQIHELNLQHGYLDTQQQKYAKKNEDLFWLTLAECSGGKRRSMRQMQRDFFANLPKDDEAIKNVQIVIREILQGFAAICERNGLTYWLSCGTLLGAVRGSGFIPWDDDGDICMPRADFERFEQIIQDDPDFQLAYYYIVGYPDGPARMAKLQLRNAGFSVFLDIFPCDDTTCSMREAAEKEWWTARQTLRENLDAALHQAQMNPQFREAILSTAERQVVDPVFRQAADVCRAGDYVIWGRDLFNYNLSWMPKDWVFPLREITFEGLTVKCPNRAEDYLKLIYGDYYRLPYDIYGDIHSGAFGYGDIDTQKKIADYVNAHEQPGKNLYRRDEEYWNSYYADHPEDTPSPFAQYVMERYLKDRRGYLVDFGCGNGRDSLYFAKNGLCVLGMDASGVAVEQLKKRSGKNPRFIAGDFSSYRYDEGSPDFVYCRFSIHAIDAEQQAQFLQNAEDCLGAGSILMIEVRSVNDALYGKGTAAGKNAFIYGGHYRRFIEIPELQADLILSGFNILEAEESTDFAPYNGESPSVIRIIAKKNAEA